jgi:hypothetical protein
MEASRPHGKVPDWVEGLVLVFGGTLGKPYNAPPELLYFDDAYGTATPLGTDFHARTATADVR